VIREFYGLMGDGPSQFTLIRTGGYMAAYVELSGNRFMVIGATGSWLFGVLEAGSMGEAAMIADGVYRVIRTADKE
jgi:hypothetical protein